MRIFNTVDQYTLGHQMKSEELSDDDEARLIYEALVESLNSAEDFRSLQTLIGKRLNAEREDIVTRVKNTALGSHLIRELFEIDSEQQLVLTTHLYFELLINAILEKKLAEPSLIVTSGRFSYSHKITIARSIGQIDLPLYNDLRMLGMLRNRYAHDLDYSMSEFDFTKFTLFEKVYQYSRWDNLEGYQLINPFLFRYMAYHLLGRIGLKHKFLRKLPRYEFNDSDDDIPF